jgi:HlyD family secretion protein
MIIMKKKVLIIGAVAIAAIAIFILIKPLAKKESAMTFDTVKVEKGTITNTVTATGTIEAITTVEVGTQVSGIIQNIYVDFNDNVKQGQVLARLDETSLRAQLDQTQASLDQAQAQLTYQESNWNRLKALYDKNLIAKADYDQALFNYENSKASVANAKSALARAKVNLDYATITSPIAGVVLNRAVEEGQTVAASFNTPTLFTIVNDLTQMEVQTSVDEADIGKVKEGQRVEFSVDAYPDDKFEGSVSQVRLQPVTTNNVVTYVVILNAPNPSKKLMPGMTASATIFVEEKANALILSGKAVRFTPDQTFLANLMKDRMKSGAGGSSAQAAPPMPLGSNMPMASSMAQENPVAEGASLAELAAFNDRSDPSVKTVWVKDTGAVLRPAVIKTGIDNGSNIEVLSGLSEGDEVIIAMVDVTKKASSRSNSGGPGGPFPF